MALSTKNWHGLMKIIDIKHWRNEKIIWSQRNIKNILHAQGEEFILRAAFVGGNISTVIPSEYYLGMDNREALSSSDTLDDVFLEPSSGGYQRQSIASSGDFTITEENDHYIAVGPLIAFEAHGDSWGPVQNVFLTNTPDNNGYLISTSKLGSVVIVSDGDAITLRISLALRDYPLTAIED